MENVLTVVYADTYSGDWGFILEIFGVADNCEDIHKICESVRKLGFTPQTDTFLINDFSRKCLGVYVE